MSSLHDIPVTTLDGRDTTMADWAGHVLLIVNTASECGLTGQYEGLQDIYDEFRMRGFFVIGVPCNQFGAQEPGDAGEIAGFCSSTYGVSFPLLAKTDVNGENEHPLYTFLKQETGGEDISWNFEKFVVDEAGEVLGRFDPRTDPEDDEIIELIEANLPI
ncbi:glutathione peroxidase [Corynebacterium sp. P7202]|uniref:Glutathione peroxidase n=1 Tax=Corynebacterium pygosceleis TaxID=2800406 RepID=A0A9Q4C929_9CORY|nr:glutathione peroxidase [Corynebacterium pygosceleis]MCK7638472.1 glutathione peroxidase [Corynebacterium pygosceleis]MCX7445368.1 glutathione peroxidase [Corynebacterium pygosceleis]MCX7469136.1 glutathione peroxidase [Corynebacterium pygosceleis]